jgi:glycine cleavage system aminomethyltransferase T
MKKLLLADFHALNGARFFAQENWVVPQNYGDTAWEVQLAFSAAGLIDRSYLGKVLLKGDDAIDLLNRISTKRPQFGI